MSKHSRVVTVEYVVADCPFCGKVVVKRYLGYSVPKVKDAKGKR